MLLLLPEKAQQLKRTDAQFLRQLLQDEAERGTIIQDQAGKGTLRHPIAEYAELSRTVVTRTSNSPQLSTAPR
jgi:hypothetical protein